MNYIIYCRRSTDTEDKQVLSLPAQESEMLAIAQRYNLHVVKILKESQSAKDIGRPVFNEMIELLKTGKADGILTWKLDRLARNFIDGGKIIDMLQKGTIQEIRTYERVCLPSDNVLMIALEFGSANQYSRDLSVNVKRGNRIKLEKGGWPNHAPLGYLNDKATKTMVIDKKKAPYIIRAYDLYTSGCYSLKQIADILFDEGLRTASGKKIMRNQVHRFFLTRLYCGFMERDGKVYKGNHQAIIPISAYERAQDVLHGRLHSKQEKHFYSARGFLTCGSCGCSLTADTKKGFVYYYCTNGKGECAEHKKYLRSEKVDDILSNLFLELKFDKELIEISALAYQQKNHDKLEYAESARASVLKELYSLTERESRFTDEFGSGFMSKELYRGKMKEIENQRVILNSQLADLGKSGGSIITFEQVLNVFLESNRATEKFLQSDDAEKRKTLGKLLSNASIKNQSVANYKFKSPYDILARTPKNADISIMLRDLDSNQDNDFQRVASYH